MNLIIVSLTFLKYLVFLKGVNGNPGGIFKRKDRHCALWIDDPLRPGINVGAGSFRMVHVQVLFYEMHAMCSVSVCRVLITL